jgi:hypothetical protein
VPVAIIHLSEIIENTSRQSQKFSETPNPPKLACPLSVDEKKNISLTISFLRELFRLSRIFTAARKIQLVFTTLNRFELLLATELVTNYNTKQGVTLT